MQFELEGASLQLSIQVSGEISAIPHERRMNTYIMTTSYYRTYRYDTASN
jgi:hypothetical protein